MALAEGAVEAASTLQVEVVYCPIASPCDRVTLELPPGSTVQTALGASGLLQRHGLEMSGLDVGVWSRIEDLAHPLRDHDRVEIYRKLTVDPMEARRRRQRLHRERLQREAGPTAASRLLNR
jgi:putative ubiquitin-RnfH superfamily antitoxin RatB of RatAB toxin-antitoxin module